MYLQEFWITRCVAVVELREVKECLYIDTIHSAKTIHLRTLSKGNSYSLFSLFSPSSKDNTEILLKQAASFQLNDPKKCL